MLKLYTDSFKPTADVWLIVELIVTVRRNTSMIGPG